MNKTKLKYLGVIAVAGGILSGVVSLTISAFLPQDFHQSALPLAILVFVFIEEISKFIAILSILKSFSLFRIISVSKTILLSIFVGFGFGLFEFFLILLGSDISINALKPMVIHLVTSLFFGISFSLIIKRHNFLALVFFLLSLLIHLCYNMFVVSNHF